MFGALIYIKTKQRDRFFIFEPLLIWSAINFPLCVCLVVALQFQAKQFLNLCRFAWFVCNRFPLSVWSFNLHLKQNRATASLYFEPLPCLQVQ
jgi:hypothetical protein